MVDILNVRICALRMTRKVQERICCGVAVFVLHFGFGFVLLLVMYVFKF
jgi:hypothetical protein